MSPHEGLIVVVPEGFDIARVPRLVEDRSGWIRKVQASFDTLRPVACMTDDGDFPSAAVFAGIGETWNVRYHHGSEGRVSARAVDGNTLLLSGAVRDSRLCGKALVGWLRTRSSLKLVPQLLHLADLHGFRISKVTLRKQRSRWGSCSSRGAISLNTKLAFLPPELVRYIMIHELCHTRHMNHSRKFWSLVGTLDSCCEVHDREMNDAWRFVPGWAESRY
jgi:predicted metal-dependent hydrolase